MNTPQRKKVTLKVVLLGEAGVGKSSVINQFVNRRFASQYKATIGTDLLTKAIKIDGVDVTLQIWDTAGQERYQSLGHAFYRGADCCVLVYDVTSVPSFKTLQSWRDEFLITANPTDPENFPFVLLGNKMDLEQQMTVSAKMAKNWSRDKNNIQHFEVSAKEGWNLNEAFTEMARLAMAREREEMQDFPVYPDRISLHENNSDRGANNGCNWRNCFDI